MQNRFGWWAVLLCLSIYANSQSPEELYEVQQARLYYEHYKWGDELFLEVKGSARPLLDKSLVMLSLYYQGHRIMWRNIRLNAQQKTRQQMFFTIKWGPLNEPHQSAPAGEYEIRLQFHLQHQPLSMRRKLAAELKTAPISTSINYKLYFATPTIYRQQTFKLHEYYRNCMKQAEKTHQKLQVKFQKLASGKRRTIPEWQWQWFNSFISELEQQQRQFIKFHQKCFAYRYPIAKSCIDEYYNLLLRLAKLCKAQLMQQQGIKKQPQERIDSFGIQRNKIIELNLQRLLRKAKQQFD